jgi:hypothetical protein
MLCTRRGTEAERFLLVTPGAGPTDRDRDDDDGLPVNIWERERRCF